METYLTFNECLNHTVPNSKAYLIYRKYLDGTVQVNIFSDPRPASLGDISEEQILYSTEGKTFAEAIQKVFQYLNQGLSCSSLKFNPITNYKYSDKEIESMKKRKREFELNKNN